MFPQSRDMTGSDSRPEARQSREKTPQPAAFQTHTLYQSTFPISFNLLCNIQSLNSAIVAREAYTISASATYLLTGFSKLRGSEIGRLPLPITVFTTQLTKGFDI